MAEYTLTDIDILADLKGADLLDVESHCRYEEYDTGDIVFDKGERTTDIFFVVDGVIRVLSAEGEDHDVALAEIKGGEIFGEFAAFDGRARSGRAIAVAPSVLGVVDSNDFLKLVREHHELAFAVIRMLIKRIRTSNDRYTELSMLPDKVRICREILRLSRPHESNPRDFILYPAPSHRELASWTGTSQEVVNDTIGWLLRSSILARAKGEMKKFVIKDFIKLKSLCEFNRYI